MCWIENVKEPLCRLAPGGASFAVVEEKEWSCKYHHPLVIVQQDMRLVQSWDGHEIMSEVAMYMIAIILVLLRQK